MYYYFSSNYPAVVKLNGIYYGTIHNAVKSCRIDGDAPFVEVCPLNGRENPTCLLLDKEFFLNPPEQVTLTDMGGGYLLKFNGRFLAQEFKVIAQQKFQDAVATVFSEGGYKLSIETKNDFYAENIFSEVNSAEIIRNDGRENLLAVCFYGQSTLLNIYDISGTITKVFSREVESAELKEKLVTVERLSDMAKHEITTEWEITGKKIVVGSKKIKYNEEFDREKLNARLIPFAFLEEMLVGGDYGWYLSEGIVESADMLRDFLGEFIGVMPPPVFREIDEVGLIYQKGKNRYEVQYFRFELKEGKISNITC